MNRTCLALSVVFLVAVSVANGLPSGVSGNFQFVNFGGKKTVDVGGKAANLVAQPAPRVTVPVVAAAVQPVAHVPVAQVPVAHVPVAHVPVFATAARPAVGQSVPESAQHRLDNSPSKIKSYGVAGNYPRTDPATTLDGGK
jgi:hypothetical protein